MCERATNKKLNWIHINWDRVMTIKFRSFKKSSAMIMKSDTIMPAGTVEQFFSTRIVLSWHVLIFVFCCEHIWHNSVFLFINKIPLNNF